MKRKLAIAAGLILFFILAQVVSAMSSPSYQIEWNNLLSGSGGAVASPGYRVNFTVGQTASRTSSSPGYQVQMGYWAGIDPQYRMLLPIIAR